MDLVRTALAGTPELAGTPVTGMLCFVDADWPVFGGSFVTGGVNVLWPAKAAQKITAGGPVTGAQALHRHLARASPVA